MIYLTPTPPYTLRTFAEALAGALVGCFLACVFVVAAILAVFLLAPVVVIGAVVSVCVSRRHRRGVITLARLGGGTWSRVSPEIHAEILRHPEQFPEATVAVVE